MFECVAITTFIWREEQDLLKVLCMQGKKKKLINSSIKKKKKEKQNEYGYNKSLPDGVDFTLIVIIVTS